MGLSPYYWVEAWRIMAVGSVIGLILLLYYLHRLTYNKYSDEIGHPEKEYRKYLKKSGPSIRALVEIPAPPGGKRDREIESLLMAGNYSEAHELLVTRMEEARLAPVGSQGKIAVASHYMEQLERMKGG